MVPCWPTGGGIPSPRSKGYVKIGFPVVSPCCFSPLVDHRLLWPGIDADSLHGATLRFAAWAAGLLHRWLTGFHIQSATLTANAFLPRCVMDCAPCLRPCCAPCRSPCRARDVPHRCSATPLTTTSQSTSRGCGNFDFVFDRALLRSRPPHTRRETTSHAPCDMLFLVHTFAAC